MALASALAKVWQELVSKPTFDVAQSFVEQGDLIETRIERLMAVAPPAGAKLVAANVIDGVQELAIVAQPTGYQPTYLSAKSGQPLRLRMQTNGNYGCTRSFVIPSEGIRKILPESGEVVIDLPPQKPGYLRFVCGMGMYGGIISIVA